MEVFDKICIVEKKLAKMIDEVSEFIFEHPELGNEEFISSKYLADKMRTLGFEVTYPYLDIPTAFRAELKNGEGARVAFLAEYDALPGYGIDKNENIVTVQGDKLVEKALKVALSEEKIETQIKKLGNTPYELDDLKINLDKGVSMPISLINQMRREAIELLDEARIPVKGRAYKDSKIKYSPKKYAKDTNSNSKIRVKINNIEALKSIINLDIDMIYYEDVATLEQAMAMATANNKKIHTQTGGFLKWMQNYRDISTN